MTKNRVPIPSDLSAEVMFSSDRTCCVCRERGKATQIHHIDEDPSNNKLENLSLLCLECHNDTQLKGGVGRKLNAPLVIKYRDEWMERVSERRKIADERAVSRQVGDVSISQQIETQVSRPHLPVELKDPPMDYINSLPEFKQALLSQAQPKWDTGLTATMVQANYDYIDSLTGVLVTLSNYYSPAQFGEQSAQKYFSEIISSRFQWHRTISEPHGPGTGGTIVNVTVGGSVMSDLEKMVEDMVMALVDYDDSFDWRGWPKRWRGNKI
ncbi:HNH endonuclease signature motif containing protein [Shewanella algidipiscicola]|uniref:HNH endonuclease signature motif containing protein n=1 Tax=Shewanella algidipiscicola TaxID=614070 RepID=UPI000D7896A5|nr:HNH endonuclease signature motif containing protein [Shewanella algidipiscicola]